MATEDGAVKPWLILVALGVSLAAGAHRSALLDQPLRCGAGRRDRAHHPFGRRHVGDPRRPGDRRHRRRRERQPRGRRACGVRHGGAELSRWPRSPRRWCTAGAPAVTEASSFRPAREDAPTPASTSPSAPSACRAWGGRAPRRELHRRPGWREMIADAVLVSRSRPSRARTDRRQPCAPTGGRAREPAAGFVARFRIVAGVATAVPGVAPVGRRPRTAARPLERARCHARAARGSG